MDQSPKCADLIPELTEARCEERLLQRHISFAALHEQTVDPLSFFRGIHAQIKICAAHGLGTVRRHIVSDENRTSDFHARVQNSIFLYWFGTAAWRLALLHQSDD